MIDCKNSGYSNAIITNYRERQQLTKFVLKCIKTSLCSTVARLELGQCATYFVQFKIMTVPHRSWDVHIKPGLHDQV